MIFKWKNEFLIEIYLFDLALRDKIYNKSIYYINQMKLLNLFNTNYSINHDIYSLKNYFFINGKINFRSVSVYKY